MDKQVQAKPQIQAVLEVLLESAADKSSMVAEGVNTAIRKIAKKHSNDVLDVCCLYCKRNQKMPRESLSELLKSMEYICQEYILEIDGDTIISLIDFAVETMTLNNSYEPLVQTPASGILVALAGKHCIQVTETLLKRMEKSVIPHYTIPFTLGSLAVCNAYGIIPYLKPILELILPLLSIVKLDYHKNSISYALGRFSDGLNEYVSNINQTPDPTITIDMFNSEMGAAYDFISNNWLFSRDPKVIESVLLAMSSMLVVLSFEKVSQQIPRIIPLLLNLYKKQKDPLPITQCLGSAIKVTSLANGTLLEPLLTPILHSLGDLVCVSPDYAQPDLLRNHSEVLRCYDRLALHFTDHCLDYLVAQLKNNNDKEKIKSLIIITHLCHSSVNVLQSRIAVLLQVLSDLSNESNIGIKKAVLKTIVAFAYKGMLPKGNEQKYLTFIVKLCCKQTATKHTEVDQQELLDLQTTADNTLYMLSTSVIELEEVLWELLLKCFLMSEFSDSCVTLLRCLTHLAARKSCRDTCEKAFIRCIALLDKPLTAFRGTFVLNFLKNIKLWPSDSYRPVWDTKIIHLLKYLEQNYDNFQEKEWEDLIYDFVTLVIQSVNDIKFNEALVLEAKAQLPLYNTKLSEKCLLLKCMALIACFVKDDLVVDVLNAIISTVKLNDGLELNTCATAIGICSRSHLKQVLEKLATIRKDVLTKKSSKLLHFSFMNSQKGEIETERIRLLVLTSYTEICNEAPGELLLQTVQHEILDFAVNEMNNCKDFIIRHACLRTIGSVADALHPNRNSLHIHMQDRDNVLKLILKQLQLHSGPEYIELYPVTLPVITSLIRLPPALESDQRIRLLKHCFNNIFNAAAIYCKINADSTSSTYYGDLKMVPFVCSSFSKLNFVVQEVLTQNLTPATLDDIVTLLEPWLGRKKAEQRLPALETLRDALQTYLDNVKFAYEGPTTFTQSGFLLARVLPRCTDPNKNIRKVAIEAVRLVLCITARYEGHMREHDKLIGQALHHIQKQIDSDEPKLLFNLTTDLAHVITIHIPHLQLPHFVNHLIDAVLDVESSSSSGSSVVLNTVLKNKSGDLLPHVADLLNKLLSTLDKIHCPHTRASTLRAVLNIAIHHSKVAIGIVLGHPIPYDQHINDCWAVFSNDPNLVCDIFEQFKKIFKTYLIYEEHSNGDKIAVVQPLQVIYAMCELFKNNHLQDICKQQFPELFSILFITMASYINTIAPVVTSAKNGNNKKEKFGVIPHRESYKVDPTSICIEALKTFLRCCGYSTIAESILTGIRLYKLEQFIDLVPLLTENIYAVDPQCASWLVANIAPYSKSDLEPQRVAVAAFLAAGVKFKTSSQNVLPENILEMLLITQNDSSCIVRQVGLQGLGYAVEFLPWDLVSRHCESILNAFMQGLDYNNISNESGVALEAMLSFSKLLKTANEQYLQSCQVTAAMRIKPLFEQEDANLREASLRLIGDLAASINHDRQPEAFKDQVCGTLITLLLHLCDDNPNVVKACKYSLRKVGPFLDSIELNSMIQDHLLDEGNLNYPNFITDLVKIMAKELLELFPVFLMTCVSYYKSTWVELRSFAALLTGLLYSHLDEESKTKISFDTVCYRLLQLLKDEHPQVRMRAIQAAACLYIT